MLLLICVGDVCRIFFLSLHSVWLSVVSGDVSVYMYVVECWGSTLCGFKGQVEGVVWYSVEE